MSVGERLKEERERLGLSQEKFGAMGGVLKRAQINYEKGDRAPDAAYLAGAAGAGVDVLYVITGQRNPATPALDRAEQMLVDNYRLCSPERRSLLIQSAAAFAAGMEVSPSASTQQSVTATRGFAAGRDMSFGQGVVSGKARRKP